MQFSDKVARGCWSSADCLKSSTFRGVKAIILPALDISTSCGTLTQWIILQACRLEQLERFCSRYRNPGCEAVDAFTISWLKENNWIFPPPYLIPLVLKHMSAGGEISTLLIPRWPSAVWWPLLVNTDGSWKAFIMGSMTFKPYQGIFLPGSTPSNVFTSDIPSFRF